jgi:hypothetical protein
LAQPSPDEHELQEEDQEEMEWFVLDDRNIEGVIKSRHDLKASRIDRISDRILKVAGKEEIKCVKS